MKVQLTDAEARNLLTYGQPAWFRELLREAAEPDPNVGLCITCGENWCEDTRCARCTASLEQERLDRETHP